MRAGGCTVQQSLTADAATVVKQAVSLARRRGNAQVTPLHVASAMLAVPGGLLRAACLRSHSHPLQCKALELCFNVALNRLPASAAVAASSPLLLGGGGGHHGHGHYYPPSLSNALVAAFKRAQAHQRRGSVESQQQQQPAAVLAVKIELEQLVVSILDDPSVSRVMREAGFSSTQVKANVVEQAVPVCSTATTAPNKPSPNNPSRSAAAASATSPLLLHETKSSNSKRPLADQHVRDDDVAAVLDCLATQRKRRLVVVAESAAAAEALARAAVDKIKQQRAAEAAAKQLQVVSLRVSSFRDVLRDEAERRLGELRRLVSRSGHQQQQVLLIVEDLKWAAEFWAAHVGRTRGRYDYCPVEHAITEVRALALQACAGEHGACWLLGFGTYQAYMKCRAGQPSLESLWGLQTLTVPTGSLALSLTCAFDDSALDTVNQSMKASPDTTDGNRPASSCWPLLGGNQLLWDCSAARIDTKAAAALPRPFGSSSSLPSWLQHCRDQETAHLTDLGNTWSSICSKPSQRMTLHFSAPVSPASSVSSYEHGLNQSHQPPRHSWLLTDLDGKNPWKPNKREKSRSNDSGPPSVGSVEVECRAKFKELNAENLKVLCGALEKAVPWQKEIVPEISSTVLQCRSGIAKRRDRSRTTDAKEETWMFFLGGDTQGKETVARELASLVFGSRDNLLCIRLGASSPSASSDEEHHRSKRPRTTTSPAGCKLAYLERLYEAVSENPHRVIIVEDVDRADRECELGIKEAIESGVVRNSKGDEVGLGDAIVILSCENFEARSRACSPPPAPSKQMKLEAEETKEEPSEHGQVGPSTSSCFDLNVNVESDHQVDEAQVHDICLLTAVDRTLFFKRHDREHQ